MSKKEEIKLLLESVKIIEKINLPHRNLQKQIDHMIESIYEEILIEFNGTDLIKHVENLSDPFEFIEKWVSTEN